MCEVFERAMVVHCAPTLAGHKCASLFTWRGCPDRAAQWALEASALLAEKGVQVRLLKAQEGGTLVYVYRPRTLLDRLAEPGVGAFLSACGYEESGGLESLLGQLSANLLKGELFPHEIGIFLDYPLEDVVGFIRHQGAYYSCQGCWKAYGDQGAARKRFQLYRKCREVYLSCYRRGFDVLRLTVAA